MKLLTRQPFRDGQLLRGEVEVQLHHRQLVYRMTDRLFDGLPQAIPRSGMGTLIAVQGSGGLFGRHESRPRRCPPQSADTNEAPGISQQIPVPLGTVTESADDDDALRTGPVHDFQAHEPGLTRAAPRVFEHQDTLAENPPQIMSIERDRRPDQGPRLQCLGGQARRTEIHSLTLRGTARSCRTGSSVMGTDTARDLGHAHAVSRQPRTLPAENGG